MWVDESKTVPGRSNIRTNISEVSETCDDVLGIKSNELVFLFLFLCKICIILDLAKILIVSSLL